MKKKKKIYDILDVYEIFVTGNPFLGKKIIKDMRNLIKLHAYKLFYKPIEKIWKKRIDCRKLIFKNSPVYIVIWPIKPLFVNPPS